MAGISINNLPLGAEEKYLSKVKIGNDIYFLKDAEVRAIVASLKEGAFVDVFFTIITINSICNSININSINRWFCR